MAHGQTASVKEPPHTHQSLVLVLEARPGTDICFGDRFVNGWRWMGWTSG